VTDRPGDAPTIGPFRLDHALGSGGMGTVYLATDTRLGRQVALKLLAGHLGQSQEFLARFDREATVLGRLDSPHIIPIYDHGRAGDNPYLVMQYAAGGDLGAALARFGPMPLALAAEVCAQVADGLAVAHAAGVVHRDIKPGNVLLRDTRLDRPHVYLCDFGVAFTEPTGLTRTGAIAGTWNYLAPERTQGDPGSPASDIYAVGCLLHELVTGRPPYVGTDVEVAMAHLEAPVPPLPLSGAEGAAASRILARAMAKEPAQRFGSAAELRQALRTLVPTGLQGTTSRPGGHRRGLVAGIAAAAVLAVAAAAGVVIWQLRGDDTAPTAGPGSGGSSSAAPAPKAVTGDVDGDGKGDVLTIDDNSLAPTAAQLYEQRGHQFRRRALPAYATGAACEADVDGDGRLDFLSHDGYGTTQRLIVKSPTARRSTFSFTVSPWTDSGHLACGDFTGDGLADAVVWATPQYPDRHFPVSLFLLQHRQDGSWAKPVRWGRFQADLEYDFKLHFLSGDLDGDGRDDLVSYTRDGGPLTVRLSTGHGFRAVAGVKIGSDDDVTPTVGDIDGDGTDELVTVGLVREGVDVWRLRGGAWKRTRWTPPTDADLFSRFIGVSDLDGDGKDDLVVLGTLDGDNYAVLGGSDTFERVWRLPLPGLTEYTAPIGPTPAWTD